MSVPGSSRRRLPLRVLALSAWSIAAAACTTAEPNPGPPQPGLRLGADLSEALYAQDKGVQFKDVDGEAKDVLQIFANHGYVMGRIRINVDPPDNPDYAMFTDEPYAGRSGAALHAAGMQLLVDLHYSHWWADPGNQWTPEAWRGLALPQLRERVQLWTQDTLRNLVAAGARPEAVQIGNEISHGMLWDLGGPSRPGGSSSNLAQLIDAGIEGTLSEVPEAQIVLHLDESGDWSQINEWLQLYREQGRHWADVDVIGLSYYPMWQGSLTDLEATLRGLADNYPDKDVWLVETAYYWSPNEAGFSGPQTPWPQNPEGQLAYMRALSATLGKYEQVKALFYWGAAWSQSQRWLKAPAWSNDDASRRALFDDQARATPALSQRR